MNDFKGKLMRFMSGRYGNDNLNKFLFGATWVFLILGFFGFDLFRKLALVLLVIYTFRMMSRNFNSRYHENQIYLKYLDKVKWRYRSFKNKLNYRKTHKIFSCPKCRKKLSVPKGKGKIEVSCPCGNKFYKKS